MVIGAAIVLSLLIPSTLVGWGSEGHEIVASLAQARLTANAKWGIRSLIGDASLASIANWAERTRFDPSATKPTTGILSIFPRVLRASPTSGTVFYPTAGIRARQLTITTVSSIGSKYSSRFSPTGMHHGMTASKP